MSISPRAGGVVGEFVTCTSSHDHTLFTTEHHRAVPVTTLCRTTPGHQADLFRGENSVILDPERAWRTGDNEMSRNVFNDTITVSDDVPPPTMMELKTKTYS